MSIERKTMYLRGHTCLYYDVNRKTCDRPNIIRNGFMPNAVTCLGVEIYCNYEEVDGVIIKRD